MVGAWWVHLFEGSATGPGRTSPSCGIFLSPSWTWHGGVEGAPGAQDTGPGWTSRARLSTLPCSRCPTPGWGWQKSEEALL